MARGFSIVFAIVIFTILALSASGSPVHKKEREHAIHISVHQSKEESSVPVKAMRMEEESRKGRQYGYPNYYGSGGNFANAQAQASASTNSFGGGGNFGNFANADARASASTNSFGGYGK